MILSDMLEMCVLTFLMRVVLFVLVGEKILVEGMLSPVTTILRSGGRSWCKAWTMMTPSSNPRANDRTSFLKEVLLQSWDLAARIIDCISPVSLCLVTM